MTNKVENMERILPDGFILAGSCVCNNPYITKTKENN